MRSPIHPSLLAFPAALGLTLVAIVTGCRSPHSPAPPSSAELISVERLWNVSQHQAFTDLVRHRDSWWCVFREGNAHIPGTNGVIRILTRGDTGLWESAAMVTEPGVDLRDPKLSIMPDGRFMLLMGGSIYAGRELPGPRKFLMARTRASFSIDGQNWTEPTPISVENQWLWRVTWHDGVGWGFAYSTDGPHSNWRLTLWRTTNGLAYDRIADPVLPTNCWPSETTLRFLRDGSMMALVRNERFSQRDVIGISRAPYTAWDWRETTAMAHGPDFTVLPDGGMIYGGRSVTNGPHTVIGTFAGITNLVPLLTLPSGGDTSYPGLVWHRGELWASYYSSHEGKSAIYLARIRLRSPTGPLK